MARTSWCIKDDTEACALSSSLIIRQFSFNVEFTPEGHVFSIAIDDDFEVHMKSVDEIDRCVRALKKRKPR